MAKVVVRQRAVEFGMLVGLLALVVRAGQVQLFQGSRYAAEAKAQRTERVVLEARRGALYDRHGTPLALTQETYHVGVAPNELRDPVRDGVAIAHALRISTQTKEEGYYPWLGGQPENLRTPDGRNVTRQVSDLVGKVRVVADQRSNSLLISANTHFFPQILKLIEDLDVPTAQVLIEAKILEVSSDFLDKLGVRWSPDGTKVFTPDDFDNSIIVHTKGEYIKGWAGRRRRRSPTECSPA